MKLEQLAEELENSKDPDCKGIEVAGIGNTVLVVKPKGKHTKIKNIEIEDNSVQETDAGIFDVEARNAIWRARCFIFPLTFAIPELPTTVALRINGIAAEVPGTDEMGNPRTARDIAYDLFQVLQGAQFDSLRNEGLVLALEDSSITATAPFDLLLAFRPAQTANAIISAGILSNTVPTTSTRTAAPPSPTTQDISKKEALTKNAEKIAIGPYLKQSVPNPHNGNTVIVYYVPQTANTAQMVITDMKGQVVKSIVVNGRGEGTIRLHTGTLPTGSYTYSLWINGRQVDAKQMVIVK
jgi:hypothetical protein